MSYKLTRIGLYLIAWRYLEKIGIDDRANNDVPVWYRGAIADQLNRCMQVLSHRDVLINQSNNLLLYLLWHSQ